jgi:hypothetical protein
VSSIAVLEDIELIPVLELVPSDFSTDDRPSPSGPYENMPDEWHRYWVESLADSGIAELTPVQRGSWNVPTSEFTDPALLRRVLEVIFRRRVEGEAAPDWGPLNGGLALRCRSQNVLVEPGCCADLGNAAGWRDAAGYREAEWRTLWIGHPWLSVQYLAPRLIISDRHEAEPPVARWAIGPDLLEAALVPAEIELERFARRIGDALPSGYEGDPGLTGRKLAGLVQ